jgi:hypothetical protein
MGRARNCSKIMESHGPAPLPDESDGRKEGSNRDVVQRESAEHLASAVLWADDSKERIHQNRRREAHDADEHPEHRPGLEHQCHEQPHHEGYQAAQRHRGAVSVDEAMGATKTLQLLLLEHSGGEFRLSLKGLVDLHLRLLSVVGTSAHILP